MSTSARRSPPLSAEEYLRLEETSSVKHEYVSGEVYALAGVSRRHNEIVGNISTALWHDARAAGCRVSINDVKLQAADDVYYYPDIMVACGAAPEDPYLEDAPCLVVEVTSPSTASTDRREKLAIYKRIPSLRSYLIVDQERRRVQHHWRDESGAWWSDDLVGRGTIELACPALTLTSDAIYAGTDLPE
jgi:Uma2 family endonuclease